MSRVGLLALVPASLGLGLAFSAPAFARRPKLAWLLGLLVAAEQLQSPPLYSRDRWQRRVDAIRSALPADCPSFYYSPMAADLPVEISQLDAMWASLDSGIPTINGYSGALPPEWLLFDHTVPSRGKEIAVGRNLGSWLERHRLGSTCWVRGTSVARFRAGHDAPTIRVFGDDLENGSLARWDLRVSR